MRGFADLQVNGYGGVNFSDPALTVQAVFDVTQRLASLGTSAFCPTVITSSGSTYARVLPVLASAMELPETRGHLLGIHLEGPFLSPEDGARGVHPREFVHAPSVGLLDRLFELAGGHVRLLTLAPERPGALGLIAHARALGITVAIGHTLASASALHDAVSAGATLSTHLGNGLPNAIHRHDNPLWPQMAIPQLTAMMITDGHHLPPDLIRAITAAKGGERIIVTSDVAPPAGCAPGDYDVFGSRVRLEPSGLLRNLDAPTLAGSSATMLDCMNHLASLGILDETGLWRAGRDNALAALGLTSNDLSMSCGSSVVLENRQFICRGDT